MYADFSSYWFSLWHRLFRIKKSSLFPPQRATLADISMSLLSSLSRSHLLTVTHSVCFSLGDVVFGCSTYFRFWVHISLTGMLKVYPFQAATIFLHFCCLSDLVFKSSAAALVDSVRQHIAISFGLNCNCTSMMIMFIIKFCYIQ